MSTVSESVLMLGLVEFVFPWNIRKGVRALWNCATWVEIRDTAALCRMSADEECELDSSIAGISTIFSLA